MLAFWPAGAASSSSITSDPDCLGDLVAPGPVAEVQFPIAFDGRLSIGDLDRDGSPDIVVSNRNKLAAYNLCGTMLWQVHANTNWDYPRHYFWNWTSYGYIENDTFH